MPYIDQLSRRGIDELLEMAGGKLEEFLDLLSAELNGNDGSVIDGDICYLIYKIIVRCYSDGTWGHRMNAIKVLESAKDEFMRNHVRPYEQTKKNLNGDVT